MTRVSNIQPSTTVEKKCAFTFKLVGSHSLIFILIDLDIKLPWVEMEHLLRSSIIKKSC